MHTGQNDATNLLAPKLYKIMAPNTSGIWTCSRLLASRLHQRASIPGMSSFADCEDAPTASVKERRTWCHCCRFSCGCRREEGEVAETLERDPEDLSNFSMVVDFPPRTTTQEECFPPPTLSNDTTSHFQQLFLQDHFEYLPHRPADTAATCGYLGRRLTSKAALHTCGHAQTSRLLRPRRDGQRMIGVLPQARWNARVGQCRQEPRKPCSGCPARAAAAPDIREIHLSNLGSFHTLLVLRPSDSKSCLTSPCHHSPEVLDAQCQTFFKYLPQIPPTP